MSNVINALYNVVLERKEHPQEGSYTCYLFDKGLDKILKKVGEECAEVIIAAKNEGSAELNLEICDLMYHLLVLMAQKGMDIGDLFSELEARSRKIGNLKQMRATDKNT